jgi:ATP-dependent DNA helicase RecG
MAWYKNVYRRNVVDMHITADDERFLSEIDPRRYVDRTERAEIAELAIGDQATVDAEVRAIHARRTRDRKRTIVNATVYDGTGLLEIVFFNQAWRERQLRPGTQVSLFGKVESYRGKRQMTNPVVDVLADPEATSDVTGTIVPVYPQSGKAEVHTWQLRRAVAKVDELAGLVRRNIQKNIALDALVAELRPV